MIPTPSACDGCGEALHVQEAYAVREGPVEAEVIVRGCAGCGHAAEEVVPVDAEEILPLAGRPSRRVA